MNKQGNDVGMQYRSVIFTSSDEQANEAKKVVDELNDAMGKRGFNRTANTFSI